MNTASSSLILLMALLSTTPSARAQSDDSVSEASLRQQLNRSGSTAPAADAEHSLLPIGNQVQLTAGENDNRAVLVLSNLFGNGVQWKATFSAPIDKANDDTSLASLDRLASGSKVDFGLNYVWFTPRPGSREQLDKACQDARQSLRGRSDLDKATRDLVDEGACDDRLYQAAYKHFVDPMVLRSIAAAYFSGKPYVVNAGLDVGVGHDDFSFLDAHFTKVSKSKTGFDIGLSASVTNVVHLWSVVASVKRQYAYEYDKDTFVQVCTDIEGTPAERCIQGYAAPPRSVDTTIASLEWRWQPSTAIALAIQASYETKDNVFGIIVPIYLVSNSDGNLRGGIKLGWRNDSNDSQVGIFVASGFTL